MILRGALPFRKPGTGDVLAGLQICLLNRGLKRIRLYLAWSAPRCCFLFFSSVGDLHEFFLLWARSGVPQALSRRAVYFRDDILPDTGRFDQPKFSFFPRNFSLIQDFYRLEADIVGRHQVVLPPSPASRRRPGGGFPRGDGRSSTGSPGTAPAGPGSPGSGTPGTGAGSGESRTSPAPPPPLGKPLRRKSSRLKIFALCSPRSSS